MTVKGFLLPELYVFCLNQEKKMVRFVFVVTCKRYSAFLSTVPEI